MRRREPAARAHARDGQEPLGDRPAIPTRAAHPPPGPARRSQYHGLDRPAFEPSGHRSDGSGQPRVEDRGGGSRPDEHRHAPGPKRYKGMNSASPGDPVNAMATNPIYVETEEEIPELVERLRRYRGDDTMLVLPMRSRIGQSRFNFQLLRNYAARMGKRVTVVCDDPAVQKMAS